MVLMELVLAKLPSWLEVQIRNLDCSSYDMLCEAVIRHLGNQRPRGERYERGYPQTQHGSSATPGERER